MAMGRRPGRTVKARKARKVARVGTVKRMISSMEETKWTTFSAAPAPTSAARVDYVLNNVAKGDDRNTRTANKIRMVSLQVRGFIQGAATQLAGVVVRCVIFLDKQANGVAPTFADLFTDPVAANNYISPFNPNYVPHRYKILKDKSWKTDNTVVTQFGVGTGTVATASQEQRLYNIRIPLKKRTVQYNDGNAGTIADIIGPSLYIIWLTSLTTAPFIAQEVCFKFKDA